MKNVNHGHEPQSKLRVLNDCLCGTDIFRCVYKIENGRQCVCNFGLPYPSADAQLELFVDHAIPS